MATSSTPHVCLFWPLCSPKFNPCWAESLESHFTEPRQIPKCLTIREVDACHVSMLLRFCLSFSYWFFFFFFFFFLARCLIISVVIIIAIIHILLISSSSLIHSFVCCFVCLLIRYSSFLPCFRPSSSYFSSFFFFYLSLSCFLYFSFFFCLTFVFWVIRPSISSLPRCLSILKLESGPPNDRLLGDCFLDKRIQDLQWQHPQFENELQTAWINATEGLNQWCPAHAIFPLLNLYPPPREKVTRTICPE